VDERTRDCSLSAPPASMDQHPLDVGREMAAAARATCQSCAMLFYCRDKRPPPPLGRLNPPVCRCSPRTAKDAANVIFTSAVLNGHFLGDVARVTRSSHSSRLTEGAFFMAATRERDAISPCRQTDAPCASYITRNDDDDDDDDDEHKINAIY